MVTHGARSQDMSRHVKTWQALPHESGLPGQVVVGGQKALAEGGNCVAKSDAWNGGISIRKYHGIQKGFNEV